jgi:hypothetical protein
MAYRPSAVRLSSVCRPSAVVRWLLLGSNVRFAVVGQSHCGLVRGFWVGAQCSHEPAKLAPTTTCVMIARQLLLGPTGRDRTGPRPASRFCTATLIVLAIAKKKKSWCVFRRPQSMAVGCQKRMGGAQYELTAAICDTPDSAVPKKKTKLSCWAGEDLTGPDQSCFRQSLQSVEPICPSF